MPHNDKIQNNALLVFAYQMMLILVLGHVLVLSVPVNKIIIVLSKNIKNTSDAVVLVSVTTMLMAFLNWGLGLIFGAILVVCAKKSISAHIDVCCITKILIVYISSSDILKFSCNSFDIQPKS